MMCCPTGKLLHLPETRGFYKRLSLFLSLDAYKSPHSPYYQLPPKVQRHSSNQLLVTPTPPALQKLLGKAGMVRGASAWRFLNQNPRAANGRSLGTCVLKGEGEQRLPHLPPAAPLLPASPQRLCSCCWSWCPALHCVLTSFQLSFGTKGNKLGLSRNPKQL